MDISIFLIIFEMFNDLNDERKKKLKKNYTKIWIFQKIMLYLKCEINLNNIIYETVNESRRCNCKNNSNH